VRFILRQAVLSSLLVLPATAGANYMSPPALAQVTLADCSLSRYGDSYICRNGLIIYISGVPGGVEDGGGPAWQPPEGWVRVGILRADPNPWGVCLTYQWVPPGSEPQYPAGTFDPLNNYPSCTPAAGAASRSPTAIAALAWQQADLPKPDPKIAPGRAIVGKDAFLETRGRLHFTHREQTPLGELRIEATGRYYVDWGDGESTGPFSIEGTPWPAGEIKHDYQRAGTYDVVITARWTATWQLGSDGGSLPNGQTSGRIDDFPAQEIQAVIVA
jgi:hypothetical protein